MVFVRMKDDVAMLPIGKGDLRKLRSAGVNTVGALLDVPEELMKKMKRVRRLVTMLVEGDRELGLLEWGMPLPARCGRLYWSLDAGTLTVSGQGWMKDYSDRCSPPWQWFQEEIRSVVIEDGVKNVGGRSFAGCERLERIVLGPSVERIGWRAFDGCGKLEQVETSRVPAHWREETMGKNAENRLWIGTEALRGTPWLGARQEKFHIVDGVLLAYAGEDECLTIPEGVVEIAPGVFEGRPIRVLRLPKSLRRIGQFAFRGTRIREITLPKGVETVGSWAFGGVKTLERVWLSSGKVRIHPDAFAETVVELDECQRANRWLSGYEMTAVEEPGMGPFRRIVPGISQSRRLGVRGLNTRSLLMGMLREGEMAMRLWLNEETKTVELAEALVYYKRNGWERRFYEMVWPGLDGEGNLTVRDWFRDKLDREDVQKLDLEGLRTPGKYVWYAAKHPDRRERETLLELTERWLAQHPEYRIA